MKRIMIRQVESGYIVEDDPGFDRGEHGREYAAESIKRVAEIVADILYKAPEPPGRTK